MQTSPPSDADKQWIETQIQIAVELARTYTGDSEDPPSLDRLDATWLAWHADPDPSRIDPNTVANDLGVTFGTHLKAALGLDWAIITDEYGTDLGLFGEPLEVTFFPANMAAKRLQENAPIFSQLQAWAVGRVNELRSRS